jgi:hypothetical protein
MKTSLAITVGVAVASLGGVAEAETFKDKKGEHGCILSSPPSEFKRADGITIRRIAFNCIAHSDAAAPFEYTYRSCNGSMEVAADGKQSGIHGLCEVYSTKGDRAAYTFVGNPDPTTGGTWTWLNGTGAFVGIKGGGTYKVTSGFPNGWYTMWTGSWEIGPATAAK